MDSTRVSWSVLGALFVASLAQPYLGCLPEPETTSRFSSSQDVLVDVGAEVVVPTLDRFLDDLTALRVAIEAQPFDRTEARSALAVALETWQELELMQLGPAGSSVATTGGADLRDEIYSWPTVNPCRVDQATASGEFTDPDFLEGALVNSYGLDAVEYLLFATPGENVCQSFVAPNQGGEWQKLEVDTIEQRRLDYALVATEGVIEAAEELRGAWTEPGGFGESLAAAGQPTSDFADDVEALNAVFDAMFYLDTTTKGAKLAVPLGLRPEDCSASCEERLEGRLSGNSTRWIVANLRGFRTLFTGGAGAGFDDLLAEIGEEELALRILDNTDAAIAIGESTAPLGELLPGTPDPAITLHDALLAVTTDLKGDLATLLSLRIPSEAAGDND